MGTETNKEAEWRRNGRWFRLWKPDEDITCPICDCGRLIKQREKEWKCSVCGRYFEEFGS